MKRIITLLKKYSALLFAFIAIGYGGFVVWQFYTTIYNPIVIEEVLPTPSKRFLVPKIDESIVSGSGEDDKINIYTFPNPFINISEISDEEEPTIDPGITGDTET